MNKTLAGFFIGLFGLLTFANAFAGPPAIPPSLPNAASIANAGGALSRQKLSAWDTCNRANGALTVSGDGQTYQQSGDNAAALFRIVSGKCAQGQASANYGNAYMSLDAGGTIQSIVGEFTLEPEVPGDPGVTTATIAIVITGDTTVTALDNLLHLIINKNGWTLQTRLAHGAIIDRASGKFDVPLAADSNTIHRVVMTAFPLTNTALISFPDGSIASVTDANITTALVGSRAYWQVIRHNATEADPRFVSLSLTTASGSIGESASPKNSDLIKAVSWSNKMLTGALTPRQVKTFTPNATGWWRIYTDPVNIIGGTFLFSSPIGADGAGDHATDIEVDISINSFSATNVGDIIQRRWSSFQSGAISQIRVGNNGGQILYFDINVSTANIPITIEARGPQVPADFYSFVPTSSPATPTNSKALSIGYGLRILTKLVLGSETGITAFAGGGQASARPLLYTRNRVTIAASAGNSVRLPFSEPGMEVSITNSTANAIQVFGNGTDTINGVATATGVSLPAGKKGVYSSEVAGQWYGGYLN
ncbi:hypothetical protein MMA231_00988 [Asticcacaulis sp. MM231]|uniref:hypothetical protein n=1 Tax=Asticcacaulis sp. MM231 TaxID=3157666 RepID=UPI0032D56EBD